MSNPLLEQYGIHKLEYLKNSPYACLYNSNIDHTPHQVEAFVAALNSLPTGGIILADEVGLGKTIEAGLVIKHLLLSGSKRILIAMPNSLRKQWQDELQDKFDIKTYIPESKYAIRYRDKDHWLYLLKQETLVVIIQYGLASFFINHFPNVVWDCFVFDEAHRLRNLGNGAKMPQNLFNATRNVPKVMLSATPLQNNLRELYALSRYIDERIFVDEKSFIENFVKNENYEGLREEIKPILHRTLRKDVNEYMKFSSRTCFTMDFKLSVSEAILYKLANDYLQRPVLYAVTVQNNGLVKMVVRKLLASSSFAVVETFEKLKVRLLLLKESTKTEKADISLTSFFELIDSDDDEIEDIEEDDIEKIEKEKYRNQIENELSAVENIIEVASKIVENSKSNAVIEALRFAFELQKENGFTNKALIFTESKRTQKYLVETLNNAGFKKIILFNGEMNDPDTKQTYNAWRARNPKKVTNTPSIDLKQAIVEEFRDNAEILIATDVASEGLNLQFCDTVINYDLPWNPMKIEQRIGRCHRYGQQKDVNVYNLLNSENAADARVYEILDKKFHLFKGVFGASDDALGLLESGSNFERKIQDIYDNCKSINEFKKAFDNLERDINAKRNKKSQELKRLLSSMTSDEKKKHLKAEANKMNKYLDQIEQWSRLTKNVKSTNQRIVEIRNYKASFKFYPDFHHGYIFVGAFVKIGGKFLLPILCAFDLNGEIITTDTYDIIQTFKEVHNNNFIDYTPTKDELDKIFYLYQKIL
jgi:SNF2 family DNA or RNA helicase